MTEQETQHFVSSSVSCLLMGPHLQNLLLPISRSRPEARECWSATMS